MGMFDMFKGKPKGDEVYILTPLGREKAEKTDLPDSKFKVMDAIRTSPSSVNDIAKESSLEHGRVKVIIKLLQEQGYVRKANSPEE